MGIGKSRNIMGNGGSTGLSTIDNFFDFAHIPQAEKNIDICQYPIDKEKKQQGNHALYDYLQRGLGMVN